MDFKQVSRFACVLLCLHTIAACESQPKVVPVHMEPRHQPVLTVPGARVLDVNLPPHDTSGYHVHAHDIFYAVLQGSEVWAQTVAGDTVSGDWASGFLGDNTTNSVEPVTHRVGNRGASHFRLIAIENLGAPDVAIPLELGRLEQWVDPEVEDHRFRAWRHELAPGESVGTHAHVYPCLVLLLSGSRVTVGGESDDLNRNLHAGEWIWHISGPDHAFLNTGADRAVVAEIEVR